MEQSGAAERFEEFVRDYGERAFQFAYRLSGNVEEAKDLVQEAYYRVLRSWDRYDASRSLDAWFFRILRNVFLDSRKRYERRHAVSLDRSPEGVSEDGATYGDLLAGDEEAVLDALERRESAGLVRETLDGLSHEHRAVLTLCDMEGLGYEEIARVLEVPVGTVRSRVSRARRAFRRRMAGRIGARQ
ncbi:MAG: RNA polymerase sigma factor [Elusimicrobiota bacterium]